MFRPAVSSASLEWLQRARLRQYGTQTAPETWLQPQVETVVATAPTPTYRKCKRLALLLLWSGISLARRRGIYHQFLPCTLVRQGSNPVHPSLPATPRGLCWGGTGELPRSLAVHAVRHIRKFVRPRTIASSFLLIHTKLSVSGSFFPIIRTALS